jgi:hypothetical protein
MMKRHLVLLLFIFCLFIASSASADLLVNQSSLEGTSFNSNTYYQTWAADDFQIAQTSFVTTFWWVGSQSSDATDLQGFNVRIYANFYDIGLGRDRPADSPTYSQYIALASVTETNNYDNSGYSSFQATTLPAFTATAGTLYWLSIQGDTGTSGEPGQWWGWHLASTENGKVGEFNHPAFIHYPIDQSPFQSTNHDFAFQLSGSPVPLPPSALLLGSGLLGLGAVGWRRRKKI